MKPVSFLFIIFSGFLFVVQATSVFAAATENIFYYYPTPEGYTSVKENARTIDILAPQIYAIDHGLKLAGPSSPDILALAQDENIDVMPLVINADHSKYLMTRILMDEDLWPEIIDALIDEAQDRGFIGWQFDFENIDHLGRDRYTEFVKQAYKKFKRRDLLLSVAVIPPTEEYDPTSPLLDWSSGYDMHALSEESDFISIMSYDDPRSFGPVSSFAYLKSTLEKALKKIPAQKISLGIPFYCWQYELGNPKKIANVNYEISANTQTKYKDLGVVSAYLGGDFQAEFFAFVKDTGKINYIFCDNVDSLKVKQQFIQDQGLRGFSAWALGQEDKRIWEHLSQ